MGLLPPPAPQEDGTVAISSDGALADAIQNQAKGQTWNFTQGTYTISSMMNITANNITLNLNGSTITTSENFAGTYDNDKHLVNVTGSSVNIQGGTLKATSANKHVLNVYGASDFTAKDLTLDHSDAGISGAPLVVNDSTVTIEGSFTTITGEKSWYAVNVDSKDGTINNGNTTLTVAENAKLDFQGVNPMGIDMQTSNRQGSVSVAFKTGVTVTADTSSFIAVSNRTTTSGNSVSSADTDFLKGGDNGLYVAGNTDGIHIGDNYYPTLELALVAAATMEGTPTINIPAGTYPISSTIEISSSVSIVGAGMDQTILQSTIEHEDLILVDGNGVNFSLSGVYVKGVENNTHNNSSALTVGLTTPIVTLSITDCKFTGFTKNSITVKGGRAAISDNVIECKAFEGAAGNGIQIDMDATATITNNQITGYESQADDWSATGILILRGGKVDTISGNTVSQCDVAINASTIYDASDDTTSLAQNAIKQNTFTDCGIQVLREVPVQSGENNASDNATALQTTIDSSAAGDQIALAIPYGQTEVPVTMGTGDTLTIPTGITLSIDKGVTLSGGSIVNNGTIENSGEISNTSITNNGTITNYGTLPDNVTGEGSVVNAIRVTTAEEFNGAIDTALDGTTIIVDGTIEGNIVIDKSIANLTIQGTENGKITNGTLSVAMNGVNLPGLTIKDLAFESANIVMSPNGDSNLSGLTITGNTFTGGKANSAIHLNLGSRGADGTGAAWNAITISDNEIKNIESGNNSGILLIGDGVDREATLAITGNTINGVGWNGIQVNNVKVSTISIQENEIRNCGATDPDGVINLYGSEAATFEVKENQIYPSNGQLYVSNISDNVDLSRNYWGTENPDFESGIGYNTGFEENVSVTTEPYYEAATMRDPQDLNTYTPSTSSGVTRYSITIEDMENGGVTSSHSRASRGTTVTLTINPDEGYELDELIVTDANGDEIDLTRKSSTKYTFEMPRSRVTVEATFVEGEIVSTLPFDDVDVDDWFYDAVEYAYENDLMNGVSSDEFDPNGTLTRGMMVTVLYRLEGEPESRADLPFEDVEPGTWYTEAVRWAVDEGIVLGTTDTTYEPDAMITREQLATMLYRYAAYKDYDTTQGGMAIREFADYEDISDWALEGLDWAVNAELVNGKENNLLDPTGSATRAETATLLMRFIEAYAA